MRIQCAAGSFACERRVLALRTSAAGHASFSSSSLFGRGLLGSGGEREKRNGVWLAGKQSSGAQNFRPSNRGHWLLLAPTVSCDLDATSGDVRDLPPRSTTMIEELMVRVTQSKN